jgi:hypothetical protein
MTTLTKTTKTVSYTISVKCDAGWRSESCTAIVEPISDKRCRVVDVIDVGGNGTTGYASRTGANRQKYSVSYFASNEIGKTKNFSSVSILN